VHLKTAKEGLHSSPAHHPKAETGRPPFGIGTMLRIQLPAAVTRDERSGD